MDAAVAAAALAGAVAGLAASAVPGLHVNALSVAALALAPSAGAPGVAFLVGALAASPFGLAVTGTLVGATGEDDALQALPAQRLAREGRAAEAVALQAWGALAGLLLAVPLAALAQPALRWLAPRLPDALPWLLALVVALLVAAERRRLPLARVLVVVPWRQGTRRVAGAKRGGRVGRRRVLDPHGLLADAPEGARVEVRCEPRWEERRAGGRLAALALLALSGLLGLAAFRLGARSPLGLPASPLLPLLAGLFALPELAAMLRARRAPRVRAALRAPRVRLRDLARAAAPGAAASALLGLVPGVSASHAALLAPRARAPEDRLVRLAAVNGGAVVFTLLAWHALGKARSGALVAAQAWAPPAPWRAGAAPPPAVLEEAALALAAALAACLLARGLALPAARALGRTPRAWAAGALAVVVAMTALTTGALGLAELAVAGLVGELPRRWGLRRGHLMGVILVPSLLRAWGLA